MRSPLAPGGAPGVPSRAMARRPWREVDYAALDFETTGLDYAKDAVISFGVVPVRAGRAVLGESVHQLIEPHVPPSPKSQTIHELRPQDLAGSPKLGEVRDLLRASLEGRFLLTWFAPVEVNFLESMFGGGLRRWRRRTIDVRNLVIAVDAEPVQTRDKPGYSLSASAARYGVPVANAHDALDDALVTAQLFLVLAEKVPGHPRPTAGDLLKLARP